MTDTFLKMQDLAEAGDLRGKTLLIRQDLNVPVRDGLVANDKRIRASVPTLAMALEGGAGVIILSHLGRPTEGEFDAQFSLEPVAKRLSELLNFDVRLQRSWLDGVTVSPGEVVLCENVRFNQGEKANDEDLSRAMAALCDIYVMDAFGTAHRAHASTHGVARYARLACAGPLLAGEIDALGRALNNPARPLVAIVGGSKVSTKLEILEALGSVVDRLIVGGGIANTFIAAAGYEVGKSLYEPELLFAAERISGIYHDQGADIPIPVDVVCADEMSESAEARICGVADVATEEMILDIGPRTADHYKELLANAGTIVWNGPVGVFEFDQFGEGTRLLAKAIAASNAFSVAGGGDTLAAIDKFAVSDQISYISTGGGAFLEFLEGKALPAVEILNARDSEMVE